MACACRRSTAFCPLLEETREQFDSITHFVDSSNIYGSSDDFSCTLRCPDADGGCLLSQRGRRRAASTSRASGRRPGSPRATSGVVVVVVRGSFCTLPNQTAVTINSIPFSSVVMTYTVSSYGYFDCLMC